MIYVYQRRREFTSLAQGANLSGTEKDFNQGLCDPQAGVLFLSHCLATYAGKAEWGKVVGEVGLLTTVQL